MLLVGGPRSGRTTALRVLAATAAARLSPDDLHLYVLDCAGGALRTLGELPHCGAAITRDDFGTAERLLTWIAGEVAQRQARLTELGIGSIAEAHEQGEQVPYLGLIIDGWESFVTASDEHDTGRSVDLLLTLLRESAAVGLTIAITGDRSALAARVASAVARKYVLRLADRADYGLVGIPPSAVPRSMPPGRALCAETGVEVQFAHLGRDASTTAQQDALAAIVAAAHRHDVTRAPLTIRPLPARVSRHDVEPVAGLILLGVGGDAPDPVAVDLFAGDARMLVAGPPRSGRSTVLRLILDQARHLGDLAIVVAAPRRSGLVTAAEDAGLPIITPDDPPSTVPAPDGSRLLLLVDDSEAFLDTPCGDALADLVRAGDPGVATVVAACSEELAITFRGVAHEVRRSRSGLLLQPGPGDGELLGLRLPRTRPVHLPGRGVLAVDQPQLQALVDGAGTVPIQVALP